MPAIRPTNKVRMRLLEKNQPNCWSPYIEAEIDGPFAIHPGYDWETATEGKRLPGTTYVTHVQTGFIAGKFKGSQSLIYAKKLVKIFRLIPDEVWQSIRVDKPLPKGHPLKELGVEVRQMVERGHWTNATKKVQRYLLSE